MIRSKMLSAALLFLSASTFAAEPPAELRYDFVDIDLAFGESDTIGNDVDFTRFGAAGSWGFHENIALIGSLSVGEIDVPGDAETTELSVGINPHFALSDNLDLVIPIAIRWAEIDNRGFSDDDTGYSIGVGVRALLNPAWELGGGLQHVDIFDDDDQSLYGSVRWHLNKLFSLGLAAEVGGDASAVIFNARFSF
jgi:hypothetical protein